MMSSNRSRELARDDDLLLIPAGQGRGGNVYGTRPDVEFLDSAAGGALDDVPVQGAGAGIGPFVADVEDQVLADLEAPDQAVPDSVFGNVRDSGP